MLRISAASLRRFLMAKKRRENAFYRSDAARLRRDELSYNAAKLNLAAKSLRYHSSQ